MRNIEIFYGPDYGYPEGWYWCPCAPGDSEVPDGPFASFEEACEWYWKTIVELEDVP